MPSNLEFFTLLDLDRDFPRAFDSLEGRMHGFLFFCAGQCLYACPDDAEVSKLAEVLEYYNPDNGVWMRLKKPYEIFGIQTLKECYPYEYDSLPSDFNIPDLQVWFDDGYMYCHLYKQGSQTIEFAAYFDPNQKDWKKI